jgi:hypothetical protein
MIREQYKPIALILVIALCISCDQKQPNNAFTPVDIDTRKAFTQIGLSQIADAIEIIPLTTTAEFLVGDIRNIVVKDKIYLQNFNEILVYHPDGKPSHTIKNKGRSEGTYHEISDFAVDSYGNMEIWDRVRQQMLFFNENGTYLRKLKIPVVANYFTKLESSYYFYHSGAYTKPGKEAFRISKWGAEGKKMGEYFSIDYLHMNFLNTPYIIGKHQNEIFFEESPMGQIYQIENDTVKPLFQIIINNHTFGLRSYKMMSYMRPPERFKKITQESSQSWGITEIGEFGIKLTIMNRGKGYLCIYNPQNHKYIATEKFIEDTFLHCPISSCYVNNEHFIGTIPAASVLQAKTKRRVKPQTSEQKRLLKTIKTHDNPCLVIGKMKRL